jgi:cell wall assembly regulator SMI1
VQADDFKHIETLTGCMLPDNFKQLYVMHNGELPGEHLLILGFYWLSLQNIEYEIRLQLEIAADYEFDTISYQKDYIQEVTWNPGWIPFAADGSGNFIALDLAPGPKGTKGQIISCGRDEQEMVVIANSLESFYSFILDQFQAGRCVYDQENQHVLWKTGHLFDELKELLLPSDGTDEADFTNWWSRLDTRWKQELIRVLGKEPSSFTPIEAVRFFFVCDEEITDLSPLSTFKNIRELCLLRQSIQDISPILTLVDLKKLSLAQMPTITDISPLAALPALQELSLYKAGVSDIQSLPQFPALKRVGLEGLQLDSLEPLSQCKKLQELSLSDIPESAYEVLSRLKNMKQLEIEGTVRNIDFLANMKKLVSLKLEKAEDGCYDILATLPKLKHLICSYEVFQATHSLIEQKIQYTLMGNTTEAEMETYQDYVLN